MFISSVSEVAIYGFSYRNPLNSDRPRSWVRLISRRRGRGAREQLRHILMRSGGFFRCRSRFGIECAVGVAMIREIVSVLSIAPDRTVRRKCTAAPVTDVP